MGKSCRGHSHLSLEKCQKYQYKTSIGYIVPSIYLNQKEIIYFNIKKNFQSNLKSYHYNMYVKRLGKNFAIEKLYHKIRFTILQA